MFEFFTAGLTTTPKTEHKAQVTKLGRFVTIREITNFMLPNRINLVSQTEQLDAAKPNNANLKVSILVSFPSSAVIPQTRNSTEN